MQTTLGPGVGSMPEKMVPESRRTDSIFQVFFTITRLTAGKKNYKILWWKKSRPQDFLGSDLFFAICTIYHKKIAQFFRKKKKSNKSKALLQVRTTTYKNSSSVTALGGGSEGGGVALPQG